MYSLGGQTIRITGGGSPTHPSPTIEINGELQLDCDTLIGSGVLPQVSSKVRKKLFQVHVFVFYPQENSISSFSKQFSRSNSEQFCSGMIT